MGHRVASQQARSVHTISCALALFVLLTSLPLHLHSQEKERSASLRGTVRDSEGKGVAGAAVHLQAQDPTWTQTAHTDSQGNYSFAALNAGMYGLRAETAGYSDTEVPSLFFGPQEAKNLDLILLPAKTGAAQPGTAQTPEFFDEPQFAVAGVTDTTNLGGHGSDTIVRTREALAKETISLSKAPEFHVAAATREKLLRERVERTPRNFKANHLLGKVLDENGKARDAILYLERARELKASDYENSYELALAYAHAGHYEQARDRAKALAKRQDTAELHHLLGDVQEKLGNPLDAVREYELAADLDPREPYLFDWGSELLLHHAPEPSLQVFTKGNRLFPNSARMLIGLGAAFFSQGSYDQAVQRICEASDLDPNNPVPYLFLGKIQSAEAPPSERIVEKLQRFHAKQPENAEANYYFAMSLWKSRAPSENSLNTEQIESLLDHAIRLDPKFAAAYFQLGILHSEQQDYRKAISDYQQAIQFDPKMQEAHYRLAQAYRKVGDAAKAEAELTRCDQIAKESAQEMERERHEIRQFVYILRDPPQAPAP
jgi:tetratricopeptide (TPR) repeat protein